MGQTVLHRCIRSGKTDFYDRFSIQIAVGIFDLPDKLPQPFLPGRIRVQTNAAALYQRIPCNGAGINTFHFFKLRHNTEGLSAQRNCSFIMLSALRTAPFTSYLSQLKNNPQFLLDA